ncbi:MAG: DUF5071 domain-containing protein [Sphingobacteriales bacterium]
MKNYIPKHSSDVRAVERLKSRAFETIRTDVPELLECLQDMHWDISHPVAEYLLPHVNEIKDELLYILSTNDEMWKHGILCFLIARSSDKIDPELVSVLKRIADQPTKTEIGDDLDEEAKEIIINKQL